MNSLVITLAIVVGLLGSSSSAPLEGTRPILKQLIEGFFNKFDTNKNGTVSIDDIYNYHQEHVSPGLESIEFLDAVGKVCLRLIHEGAPQGTIFLSKLLAIIQPLQNPSSLPQSALPTTVSISSIVLTEKEPKPVIGAKLVVLLFEMILYRFDPTGNGSLTLEKFVAFLKNEKPDEISNALTQAFQEYIISKMNTDIEGNEISGLEIVSFFKNDCGLTELQDVLVSRVRKYLDIQKIKLRGGEIPIESIRHVWAGFNALKSLDMLVPDY